MGLPAVRVIDLDQGLATHCRSNDSQLEEWITPLHHAFLEAVMSTTETVTPSRRPTWIRGAWMIGFIAAAAIAQTILNVIAIIQFLWLLIAGEPNARLAAFGKSLAAWAAETIRFLTMASDDKPFPCRDWPAGS